MSYCRFFWDGSDVYVYESARGIECCGCSLEASGVTVETPEEMIEHLLEHRAAGHTVPDYALEELRAEAGLPLEHAGRDFHSEHIAWLESEAAATDDPRTRGMLERHAAIWRDLDAPARDGETGGPNG